MELYYFKSPKGNFGDDLNPWLWPQIFSFDDISFNEDCIFLGVGSILHANNKNIVNLPDKKKIVFGTGIRPLREYNSLKIDDSWDFRFLRGPLSRFYLGNRFKYISDAAYALMQTNFYEEVREVKKKYKLSFMPYFHSVGIVDWKKICEKAGIHYISPFSENGVEFTMREIAASEYIISEAMHGAIISDILRVPWHRLIFSTPFTEGERISDFKWTDWLQSIDVFCDQVSFIPFYRKSFVNSFVRKISMSSINVEFFLKLKAENEILECFKIPKKFYLSSDGVIRKVNQEIFDEIDSLKCRYLIN